MYSFNKIYVAGHTGLVGGAIYRLLQKLGYENIIVKTRKELDLTNQYAVDRFFDENRPEFVFLAAAKVGGINYNKLFPADFITENLQIQTNVISSSHKYRVEKLLFLGSACIYPKETLQPIKEEYLMSGPLEQTNDGYALAKIAGLTMCKKYNLQYGNKFISCMPTNLYGPFDRFSVDHGHVIPGLINKFLTAKENNMDNIVCWGDGSPTREFLYSEDLANACVFLMKEYNSDEIINVGINNEITIKELAEIIKKIVGFDGEILWDTSKPNGTPRRAVDSSKIMSLGWKPKVDLETGIRLTLDWYKQNRGNCK